MDNTALVTATQYYILFGQIADFAKIKNQTPGLYLVVNGSIKELYYFDGNNWIKIIGESGSSASSYIYTQNFLRSTWIINHNLNRYPSVTITDTNNQVMLAEITYNNANTITINFSEGVQGTAYLN